MMRRVILGLACFVSAPMSAQMEMGHDHSIAAPPNPSVERLIEQARAATEIFSDRSAAIANGYHRAGRDLPMMGEHWLSTRRLIDGGLDVTRPQILMYMNIDGKPTLTGIVFAIPLGAGESPPDVFGPGAMWHEHNGTVDDEALLAQHHTVAAAAQGTRVAFLHVWTRAPFSESVFGAENWALPFVRAGLPVPAHFSEAAARCLGVLNGKDFYLDLIGASADSSSFAACENTAAQIVAHVKSEHRGFTDSEVVDLAAAWNTVMHAVEARLGTEMATRINGGAPLPMTTSVSK
jgi:hypothetical protein